MTIPTIYWMKKSGILYTFSRRKDLENSAKRTGERLEGSIPSPEGNCYSDAERIAEFSQFDDCNVHMNLCD